MSHDEPTPDALSALESQLASLRPAARIDRDQLMFRAGAASHDATVHARRGRWLLFATNSMSALAAGLIVAFVLRDEPQVIERVSVQPAPVERQSPPQPSAPRGPGYLALRDLALAGNWSDAAQHSSTSTWEKSAATPSYRQLLEQYSQELR